MRLSLLTLAAAGLLLATAMPAAGQIDRTTRATVAPDTPADRAHPAPILEAMPRFIEEGVVYGHFNRPGSITVPPNRDVFGYFDANDPETSAVDVEPYPVAAFAGAVAGDDRLYFVLQPAEGDETLGWFDFDTQTLGPDVPYTMFDQDGNEIAYADLPQWVDAGINTDTGEMVLLGRATGASGEYGCTVEHGASLFTLDLATAQGRFLMHFNDTDACPLSGAYDNENERFIGLIPETSEVVQVDLATGDTETTIPLPSDIFVASFIQSGATNYGEDDDPSNNEMWLFLFQEVAPGSGAYFSTARRAEFAGNGVITGLTNFGLIDNTATYTEVLTSGFKNNAPPPGAGADFSIAVTPLNSPVPRGERLRIRVSLTNDGPFSLTGDLVLNAIGPGGTEYERVFVDGGTIDANATAMPVYAIPVTSGAPLGDYTATVTALLGGTTNIGVAPFTFSVTEATRAHAGSSSVDSFAFGPVEVIDGGGFSAGAAEVGPTTAGALASEQEVTVVPNPFVSQTAISFEVAEAAPVRLAVYDVLGREVAVLVDDEVEAGAHSATFDAHGLAAGTYVYRLVVGGAVQTGRMTLMH